MTESYFETAGLIFKIEAERKIEWGRILEEFQCTPKETDLVYCLYEKEIHLTSLKQVSSSSFFDVYEDDTMRYRLYKNGRYKIVTSRLKEDSSRMNLYGCKEAVSEIKGRQMLDYLTLEEPLLKNHAFFLHSAFVRWKGQGILFCGPSGVGKSTQADLWESYMGAEILNGDRTIIRRTDEGYFAYGSMYAGSSHIYRNESARLSAVILLEQAEVNELIAVKNAFAFQRLYSQVTSNPWNPHFVEQITDELLEMLNTVPIYLLRCRPDKEAVELVKSAVERENDYVGEI